nr:Mur ligase family protein [Oceanospirillum sediminis]
MLQLSHPLGCNLTIDKNDGSASISLAPPVRPVTQRPELQNPRIIPELLSRFSPVPEDYQTASVPEHCRITPVRLGPLTLLGVHISPDNIQQRQMIYVESYWCCDEIISEDMRLDIRAAPMMPSTMPDWGHAMDHDPCDWMQPTSQWQPGVIYRDRYGLRPPPLSAIKNIALKISIRLTGTPAARKAGKYIAPQIIHINIQGCSAYENTDYRQTFSDEFLKTSTHRGWNAGQLEEITGGRWINPPADDWLVQSVVRASNHIDCVTDPCLYVASDYVTLARHERYSNMQKVYDNNWNSHRKIKQIHHCIAGAIVSETTGLSKLGLPLLKVQDPIKAMIEIGIASRKRLKGKVICITGSAGKSSTLHAMNVILGQNKKVWTTYNNYNSRVGLFVVLASAPYDADFVVLETAISAINTARYKHIRYVSPDITVITNISAAHLKPGETTLDIARKKTNIFNGMQPGMTAVICSETEHFDYMLNRAAEFKLQTICYGLSDSDHIQLKKLDDQGIAHIRLFDQYIELPCGHQPEHIVLNLLSCLAVLVLSEENYTDYLEAFSQVGVIEGRGIRSDISTSFGRIQIIDDAYNANPISMKAALRAFKASTTPGRKIMVLGDMLELSDQSEHYHRALTPMITDAAADQVLLTGEQMSKILPGLENSKVPYRFFESTDALTQYLSYNSLHQDLILFKASNGIGLRRVIQQLQQQISVSDHT